VDAASLFLYAAGGAAIQEILWWHNLRFELEKRKYQKLLSSGPYWGITLAFIASAGVVALAWYAARKDFSPRDVLLFGASLPLLLKATAKSRKPEQHLGDEQGFELWDYFG
jgi:hypothetical protein